jgi:nucleoside-diphosphate-sugar epimerase
MTQHLFSFGHGYSAAALADRLLPQGWKITGTTRSPEKAVQLKAQGISAIVSGSDDAAHDVDTSMRSATHLLVSAGPDPKLYAQGAQGDPFLRDHLESLKQAAPHLQWVGYLSTTGVYGDHQGGWVDEDSPLTPATIRGQARVSAEAAWQDVAQELGLTLRIFRLAGIYGPGRGPFSKVRNGTARRIIKAGQVFSRTHVEDIAQVLEASINRPETGSIFNVCDNVAAPPEDVIGHAAELLGLPVPPAVEFETAEMTPMARSFYAESKKVRNDRIKTELGVELKYPDYQTGLAALLALENSLPD